MQETDQLIRGFAVVVSRNFEISPNPVGLTLPENHSELLGNMDISVGITGSQESYFMCWSGAETFVPGVSLESGFEVIRVVCIFVLSGCVIQW